MGERRPLIAGLAATAPSPADKEAEHAFVYTRKQAAMPPAAPTMGRVPLTTRLREDYAKALKRASLERQMEGVVPNTLQDIVEEALGPWLKTHGYLGE